MIIHFLKHCFFIIVFDFGIHGFNLINDDDIVARTENLLPASVDDLDTNQDDINAAKRRYKRQSSSRFE